MKYIFLKELKYITHIRLEVKLFSQIVLLLIFAFDDGASSIPHQPSLVCLCVLYSKKLNIINHIFIYLSENVKLTRRGQIRGGVEMSPPII